MRHRWRGRAVALVTGLSLAACSYNETAEYDALVQQVQDRQVGYAKDHWIEMKNLAGDWERTGLVFGYADDYDECTKAIAGLKAANGAREYRCVPAN